VKASEKGFTMSSRALKLLSEKRLLKILVEDAKIDLVVSYGANYDRMYLLLPGRFCSCASFYFDVYSRRVKDKCIHLRAFEISKSDVPIIKIFWEEFKNKLYPLIFKGMLT